MGTANKPSPRWAGHEALFHVRYISPLKQNSRRSIFSNVGICFAAPRDYTDMFALQRLRCT